MKALFAVVSFLIQTDVSWAALPPISTDGPQRLAILRQEFTGLRPELQAGFNTLIARIQKNEQKALKLQASLRARVRKNQK
jgi:hypothetical protein